MTRVAYQGYAVGVLEPDGAGGVRLIYDPRWRDTQSAFPVSLSFPLSAPAHDGVETWLRALAPEADGLALAAGLPPDPLALLGRFGAETPGGLSFGAERGGAGARVIPDGAALERLIQVAERAPLQAGDPDLAFCGGGGRLPVAALENGALALPERDATATHWLEPEPLAEPGRLEDRAFRLELARLCGLESVGFRAGRAGARRYLLLERADRRRARDGRWVRLHSETLAQAAGGAREPAELFALAAEHLSAKDRLRLLDMVIFSALGEDVTADLARLALTLTGGPKLAPLTDAASLGPWPAAERRLTPPIGGPRRRADRLRAEHWRRFAQTCGLNQTFTLRRVAELAQDCADNGPEAVRRLSGDPVLKAPVLDWFRRRNDETCATVVANAQR